MTISHFKIIVEQLKKKNMFSFSRQRDRGHLNFFPWLKLEKQNGHTSFVVNFLKFRSSQKLVVGLDLFVLKKTKHFLFLNCSTIILMQDMVNFSQPLIAQWVLLKKWRAKFLPKPFHTEPEASPIYVDSFVFYNILYLYIYWTVRNRLLKTNLVKNKYLFLW